MSKVRASQRKPVWLRICGDQAFNTYSLLVVSSIATIGTLSIYTGYDSQQFSLTLIILAIAQFAALSPIFVIAPLTKKIRTNSTRFASVISTYILINILRSIALDYLLIRWGIESESRLEFRIYSNVIFLTLLYSALAWVSDYVTENLNEQVEQEKQLVTIGNLIHSNTLEILQARTYASRELSLEIGAIETEVESLAKKASFSSELESFLLQLKSVLQSSDAKLRNLVASYPQRRQDFQFKTPSRYSPSTVIAAGTFNNPYSPELMGGLSFVALAGWLGYFVPRTTALKWSLYLAIYSFLVYLVYQRFLVPRMRKYSSTIRLIIYEISLVPFIFFWLAVLGYVAGDDSTTYGIAATNALSVFGFANIATFVSGLLNASNGYRDELQVAKADLESELANLNTIRLHEEIIWKELFAGKISSSPTTATVRIREAIESGDAKAVAQVAPSVIEIWRNVDRLLTT